MTTEAALAGLVGSVALYVAAAVVNRRLEIAVAHRLPPEWKTEPRLRDSGDAWAAFSVTDYFRHPGWAVGWLIAIAAFALVFTVLGAHWWTFGIIAVLYAAAWTRAERHKSREWGRQLREEHSTPPSPRKLRLFGELRWIARFLMWLAFIAAPAFAGVAIAELFVS